MRRRPATRGARIRQLAREENPGIQMIVPMPRSWVFCKKDSVVLREAGLA